MIARGTRPWCFKDAWTRINARHQADGPSGCWNWTGHSFAGLYPVMSYLGHQMHVSRIVYILTYGPIPEGLHIDHLCRRPGCINPNHLELVTPAENSRRAAAVLTHCTRGHRYQGENLGFNPAGHRRCLECHRRDAEQKRRGKNIRRICCGLCRSFDHYRRYCSQSCGQLNCRFCKNRGDVVADALKAGRSIDGWVCPSALKDTAATSGGEK